MATHTFPKISKEQWLEKVTKDLKGRAIEELDWQITDEIVMSPIHHDDEVRDYPTLADRSDNQWITVESIHVTDLVKAHTQIITALQNGASGIALRLDKALSADELATLLSEVYLNMIHVEFDLAEGVDTAAFISELEAYLTSRDYAPKDINGAIYSKSPKVVLPSKYTSLKTITAKADGSCTEQLASLIYQTNQQIDQLIDAEVSPCHIASSIDLTVSLTDEYLVNIASIRALQRCIQLLLTSYNDQLTIEDISIKAVIDHRVLDQDINYGRIQTSAMALSGIIGGAERIAPYSSPQDTDAKDAEYDRRIARNIAHILSLESYMDRVNDPAAGSYYIEELTDRIAEQAWQSFTTKWEAKQ